MAAPWKTRAVIVAPMSSRDRDENPAISLLIRILEEARSLRATAIHFEPDGGDSIRVRFRVEGALRDGKSFTRKVYAAIVGRVKTMAGMEVAERRRAQSGSR